MCDTCAAECNLHENTHCRECAAICTKCADECEIV
ncbi:MAG: four-helix bundle copper-binding protein [Ferruginibacter sp.]